MLRVLVLHGPNLNLLGTRERAIYGKTSLDVINRAIRTVAGEEGVEVDIRQSNIEGELVTWIQEARHGFDGIVINPAGYTHTSVAIRDAITAVDLPTVEVHISNIHQREAFRQQSFIAGVALAQISGFGAQGYELAIRGLARHLRQQRTTNTKQRPVSPRTRARTARSR
jgi:3-dehydroquinate dehydratase-2